MKARIGAWGSGESNSLLVGGEDISCGGQGKTGVAYESS